MLRLFAFRQGARSYSPVNWFGHTWAKVSVEEHLLEQYTLVVSGLASSRPNYLSLMCSFCLAQNSHILLFSLMILALGSHFTITCVCYSLPISEETVCILSPTLSSNIIYRKFFNNLSSQVIYYCLAVIWLYDCIFVNVCCYHFWGFLFSVAVGTWLVVSNV